MKTATVTVEETHYSNTDYPFNVWLEGRWFHLETGDHAVELGDEITVKYHPQDQFATMEGPAPAEPNPSDVMAEKIFQVLSGQRFDDWYGDDGEFGIHIRGDFRKCKSIIPPK